MPLVFILGVALLVPLVFLVLMPIGLVQRYRAGTARRPARSWVTGFNIAALVFSTFLFLGSAAITNFWVRNALSYSVAGFAAGCVLGVLGLVLTRWEGVMGRLYYTPNRFLVLTITLLVAGRIVYGVWRVWTSWSLGAAERGWMVESGIAGSMAAGALVLGYWLAYWIGIRRKARGSR